MTNYGLPVTTIVVVAAFSLTSRNDFVFNTFAVKLVNL